MAQLGFGLNINETAQESGFDQFSQGLGDTLKAVAADNWNFNPISSILLYQDILQERRNAIKQDDVFIDRQELNTKYKNLGLFFEQDEPQSVVDIIVQEKKDERRRQSIIDRGSKGALPFAAKFLTGLGVSVLDPINIGVSFIPVFGQARFAALAARQGFTKARAVRGTVEGAVGATLVEPIVYGVAQSVQADYDIVDSFLNVTFGTLIGGGLHVGAGKLRDMNTARKFRIRQEKIKKGREMLDIKTDEPDPELNLYKEYYPENSKIMMQLEKSDPETRRLILAKSVGDLLSEKPVDVTPIAQKDAALKNVVENSPDAEVSVKPKESNLENIELNTTKRNQKNVKNETRDAEIDDLQSQLDALKAKQKDTKIKFKDDTELKSTTDELDELNTRSNDLDEIVKDAINCVNGR
jgi:hypothetical protein